MKQIFTSFNRFVTRPLLLASLLLAMSSNAWGQTYNGSTWYSAKPGNFTINTIGNKVFDAYPPSTGSITYAYTYKKADLTGWFANFQTKIYCSTDNGSSYGSAIDGGSGKSFKSYSAVTVSGLEENANKIKFDRPTGNTHNMTYTDIKLPMAPHIRLKSTSNTAGVTSQTLSAFPDTEWGSTCATTRSVTLRSFLTATNDGVITITSSNPKVFRVGSADNTGTKTYNVGKNMFAYESGSGNCSAGKAGKTTNYNFKIYFVPEAAKNYTGTITISNGTSTATVSVSGKGLIKAQSVNWTQETNVNTDDNLTLSATATSGLNVSYSVVSGSDVATVDASTGVVTIIKSGKVTFRASQSGKQYYYSAATPVDKEFAISKVTPVITANPTSQDALLPKTLAELTLTGGAASSSNVASIAGAFSWQTPATEVERRNTGYTVVFTPSNTNWYNTQTCNVLVGIEKYTPKVTTNTLSAELTYGDNLEATAIVGELVLTDIIPNPHETISGTYQWKDQNSKPEVGTETAKVMFVYDDDEWFLPIEFDVPITVNRANPTIAATAIIVEGQALSEVQFVNATTGQLGETVDGDLAWADGVNQAVMPEVGTAGFAVNFASNDNNYNGGTGVCTVTVIPGLVFNGGEWTEGGSWSGGEVPLASDRVVIDADVTISCAVEVTALTINEGNTVTIADGGTLTIGNGSSLTRATYGDMVVEAGGQLRLGNGEVQVNDFTLYSTFDNHQPKSGQVAGQQQLTTHGDAYFVLDLDSAGVASYGWYGFTVPFPVDALNGITRFENGGWQTITNEVNYAIMDYHEDLRAQGKYGWKKYRGILQPGTGYLMTVENAVNRYRFRMVDGGAFNAAMTQSLTASEGTELDKGWNSIGNGTMTYVSYDEMPRYAQLLDHKNNTYQIIRTASNAFVVGAAYFVQTTDNSTLTMIDASDATTGLLRAPQRRQMDEEYCSIDLSLRADGRTCDNLFITCSDNAVTTYTIGKDVLKMGATSDASVARLWSSAKGAALGAVDMPFSNDEAIIPLNIHAPKAGEYALTVDNSPTEDICLMRNGVMVWNMSAGAFALDLTAGTDRSYALRVTRRTNNVATGAAAADVDQCGADLVEKIIVNGQFFILRNGVMYDAQGRRVTTF